MRNSTSKNTANKRQLLGQYNTPERTVIELFNNVKGYEFNNYIFLEPSFGSGNIIKYVKDKCNFIKHVGSEKTVILSTHILSEVEATCNRVVIISTGEIVADGTTETLRKDLTGQAVIHLEIKGDKNNAYDIFSIIEGVEKVEILSESTEDTNQFDITVSNNKDIREEIFKKVVENKWVLLEMNQHKTNLEEVFRQLTLSQGGGI